VLSRQRGVVSGLIAGLLIMTPIVVYQQVLIQNTLRNFPTVTSTTTSTITSSITTNNSVSLALITISANQSTSQVSTQCFWTQSGLTVRLLEDNSTTPVTGVTVSETGKTWCPNLYTKTSLVATSSDGTIPLVGDWMEYSFVFAYSDHVYTFCASSEPTTPASYTLYVPSGELKTSIGINAPITCQ
jgi:hypothetical protein